MVCLINITIMEYITIKNDESLKSILQFTDQHSSQFIFNTLNYLHLNDWIADSSDEWGKTIGEILDESIVDSYGVAILALKTNYQPIIEAFRKLSIVGHGDCPECGGDTEERYYNPDPTKDSGDYICDFCKYETIPN